MKISVFKYLSPFLLYYGAIVSFLSTGFVVWLPVLYAWCFIPLLELFMKPDDSNLSSAEEELAKHNRLYDWMLYLVVPLQYLALGIFLYQVSFVSYSGIDLAGKTMAMGLLCGVMGINVGHELGHRVNRWEQRAAKALLLTSLYMHFFIEHNKGHHKRVATPEDPSSARYNEWLYGFYFRSIGQGLASAWHIALKECRRKGHPVFSMRNELVQYLVVQLSFLILIYFLFGGMALLLFLAAAVQGILLLETVNYIEHYGLQRRELMPGKWERTRPQHSWNSNHVIGRVILFELSRHSDHHFLASRKYQVLRHHHGAPQMPTGYPGMMLLATLPPLWFRIMNRKIINLREKEMARLDSSLPSHQPFA